jgi:hypothetical protein
MVGPRREGDRALRGRPQGRAATDRWLPAQSVHREHQTLISLLYGKTPQVDVARRFADSEDDQARVASEMLERLLNTDIEKDNDTAAEAFRQALEDRLLPGMGNVRSLSRRDDGGAGRGALEEGQEAPEVKDPSTECVYVDYVYWKDQLWSPCRTFHQLRWWAFGNEMSEADFVARFGKDKLKAFQDKKKSGEPADGGDGRPTTRTIWPAATCGRSGARNARRSIGSSRAIRRRSTTKRSARLENFWPFPRPMVANLTTSKFLPTPDFVLAQDLYDGIDTLESRINLLEDAIRVAGLYDRRTKGQAAARGEGPQRSLSGRCLGGLRGEGRDQGRGRLAPAGEIVGALDKLRECRTEKIGLLYQVTGMSDIMRGQASQQTTATEQAIKARFASVRVQSMQDEFARFCSDVQKIKAEIISKHFEPQTIIDRSNVMRTPDAQLAQPAVELIKSSSGTTGSPSIPTR